MREHHIGHSAHRLPSATEGRLVVAEPAKASGATKAEEALLHRVLHDLFADAVKFTERVHVRLAVADCGAEARVAVEDAGIGIDPASVPDPFSEFRQASSGIARTYEGLGLAPSRTA